MSYFDELILAPLAPPFFFLCDSLGAGICLAVQSL